jgi:hypothetical protein
MNPIGTLAAIGIAVLAGLLILLSILMPYFVYRCAVETRRTVKELERIRAALASHPDRV